MFSLSGQYGQEQKLCLNHGRLNPKNEDFKRYINMIKQKQEQLQELKAGWNYYPQILAIFIDIKLPYICVLSLSGNCLKSLESLHRIYMPRLKHLQVGENQITSYQMIRKSYWPHIHHLYISNKVISEVDRFEQLNGKYLQAIVGGFHKEEQRKLMKSNFLLQMLVLDGEQAPFLKKKFYLFGNQRYEPYITR